MTTMYDENGKEVYINSYERGYGSDGTLYRPDSYGEMRGTFGERLYEYPPPISYKNSRPIFYGGLTDSERLEKERAELEAFEKKIEESIQYIFENILNKMNSTGLLNLAGRVGEVFKKIGVVMCSPYIATYKLSKFVLDKATGERPANKIAAGVMSAAFVVSVIAISVKDSKVNNEPSKSKVSLIIKNELDLTALKKNNSQAYSVAAEDFKRLTKNFIFATQLPTFQTSQERSQQRSASDAIATLNAQPT